MANDELKREWMEILTACPPEWRGELVYNLRQFQRTKGEKTMFEKIYRPLVLILLAIIAIAQFLTGPASGQSNECLTALAQAQVLLDDQTLDVTSMINDYREAVYERAENINQQILLGGESRFFALQMITLQNSALLRIQVHCR